MILLSFDTEEFDVPREHGVDYSLEEGMKVSVIGTNRILDVLKRNGVRATFFCTGNFAEHAPEVMKRIMDEGHEVACHGVDHWQPADTDFARSKEIVERVRPNGLRLPPTPDVPRFRVGNQACGLPLQLIAEPCVHPWPVHAPDRTAYLVHERWRYADTGLGHAMAAISAVLAVTP